jgi:hypothetical protein
MTKSLEPTVKAFNGENATYLNLFYFSFVTPKELISEFHKITGVPILLNTSFNENEPIVNNPQEAINCFLRTKMDVLVLHNWIIRR